MLKLILVTTVLIAPIWWWWPSLGAPATGFPGNREISERISTLTGGGAVLDFDGAASVARPLPSLIMPEHPFQNNSGYAGAHADSYNSGVIPAAGPTGRAMRVHSRMIGALPKFCSTQHFDRKGRVVTVCVGVANGSRLVLLDPENLEILAVEELPKMGGWHIRLDTRGRVVVPAGDLSIRFYSVDDSAVQPVWVLEESHDLSTLVPKDRRVLRSVPLDIVADWQGNWWFTLLDPAIVGYVDVQGRVHAYEFEGEKIENGLTASNLGVFVATTGGLNGMVAGSEGVEVFTRIPYEAGAGKHSISAGSGTTPVIFAGGELIALGDNADPRPNVLVYRIEEEGENSRLVCKVPVFREGRSVLENSFIGYNLSLVVENNMGFKLLGDSSGAESGFVRIDVRPDFSGCDIVWENYAVRAGTGAKLSLGTGLIYVHELLQDTGVVNAWYLSAIDFQSGELVWRKYLGSGKQWDNALLTVSIGPDGVLVSGTLMGLVAVRDGIDKLTSPGQ